MSTDYYGNGTNAYQIKVKWDDNLINTDVRWCGNIVLQNDINDPQGVLNGRSRKSKIVLSYNKKLTLDQGLSPTTIEATQPFTLA